MFPFVYNLNWHIHSLYPTALLLQLKYEIFSDEIYKYNYVTPSW